ncbi:MAG: hypothetical protein ACXAAH_18025 [Promethearchaeota archaeon]|jgi:hypothetical protein
MDGAEDVGSTDRFQQIHFRKSDNTIAFRAQLKMLEGGWVSGEVMIISPALMFGVFFNRILLLYCEGIVNIIPNPKMRNKKIKKLNLPFIKTTH